MKSRVLIGLFIFYTAVSLYAQKGTPFISNYTESGDFETQIWSICQDDKNIMLFANRKGIITYNGSKWEIIHTPSIPTALKKNPINNLIYVGANDNYGFLRKNSKGFYQYISISGDSANVGVITDIHFVDSSIYFYGDRTIVRHKLADHSYENHWNAKDSRPFTGLISTSKNTFINVHNEGLYRLEDDTLFPIVTGYWLKTSEILFSLPYNEKRILIGTDKNILYLFDGIKFYHYNVKDNGYLKESIISDAIVITDSLYAFATLDGGVEVVNKISQKVAYTINYQNGLPDDEIFALGTDNNHGLWLSHEYGVSRVDFSLPIRNFSQYPGLEGNLTSSIRFQNQLYVATSEGIYYLTEVKDYSEAEVLIRLKSTKKKKISAIPKTKIAEEKTEAEETETSRPIQKFFSSLFSKKQEDEIIKEEEKPLEIKEVITKPKEISKPRYIRKKVKTLRSISYIYKKVYGIDEKCKQLVAYTDGILVATNSGLYKIEEHKAEPIVKGPYINQIELTETPEHFYIATNTGFFSLDYTNYEFVSTFDLIDFQETVYSVLVEENTIWLGGDNKIHRFNLNADFEPIDYKTYAVNTLYPEKYVLQKYGEEIRLFLEAGIYRFDPNFDSFILADKELYSIEQKFRLILSQHNNPWVQSGQQYICLNNDLLPNKNVQKLMRIFSEIYSIYMDRYNDLWIINSENQLYRIEDEKCQSLKPDFDIFVDKVQDEEGLFLDHFNIILEPENNSLSFNIIAPFYQKEHSVQYQYYVMGLMKHWSKWSTNPDIHLLVKSGNYTLQVKAKDLWGNTSKVKTIPFSIKPKFTETILFYFLIALFITISVLILIKIRERTLQHDKKILEQKVRERTAEIAEQKEEIEAQRDEITTQRDEIFSQKEEITSSINYASKIQKAMLPFTDLFNQSFSEHFILLKPRDIVSGDFYWAAADKDRVYFTAADCTGHGVPGALMSMLGISSLNEVINQYKNLKAFEILNILKERIIASLHQTGKQGESKDGMDLAFCIYHKHQNLLEFAGAFNPLILIREGEITEIRGDRMPIGIYRTDRKSFTNHEIKIQKGDTVYLFSDGYADQFGGERGEKFKSRNLKELLMLIHEQPLIEQKHILEENFEKWQGRFEQLDDVILIGIKF